MQIQNYIVCLRWLETLYGCVEYNVKLKPLWNTPQRKVCYVDRKMYNWHIVQILVIVREATVSLMYS